jgi:putative membrane protein
MARQSAPGAPAAARQVISEVVDSSAQGAVDIKVWATLTFSPAAMGAGKQNLAEQEIATRLPGLTQTLQHAGTGPVHLMTAGELCQMVRIAHDPASAALFDTAASRGETVALKWGQCGPAGHEALSDRYEHDSGVSRVWTMSSPPSGTVQFRVLEPILGLHPSVERKRVAILYRPIDAAMAPSIIDNDVNQANARLTGSNPSARAVREAQVAHQMANEEAAGGGLLDFGAVITCTTTSGDVEEAAAPVESLAASSRLLIREAWGAQDSGFAVGLPLGLQPGDQDMRKRSS